MPTNFRLLAVILSVGLLPLSAAVTGQATTPTPGSFAGACAGTGFSGSATPGLAPNGGVTDSAKNCGTYTALTGLGTAAAIAAKSGTGYSGTANASASQGQIHVYAASTGSASISFPGAQSTGGWNDTFTITGGSGNGIWAATILVQNSTLSSVNNGASASASIAAYKNGSILQPYGSAANANAWTLFNANNVTHNGPGVVSSWDYQMVVWGSTNWGPSDPWTTSSMSVPHTYVTFYIPFTYGVAFDAGFYLAASAGQRAAGGDTTQNSTEVDFGHSAYWNGKGQVYDTNGAFANLSFSIVSESGFDYNNGVVPEPSAMLLSGAGLFAAGLLRRRRLS